MTVTRRALLLGCAGLVVGCSAQPRQNTAGPTRTVDSHMGPVEIPSSPQRIVCLDQYSTLALLDVGVTPTATIDGLDAWMPENRRKVYNSLPRVGGYEANPEKILSHKPDLILGNSAFTLTGSDTYDKLSKIAPTVILTTATASQWQKMALRIADTVNRAEQMEKLRSQYLKKAEGLKNTHSDALANTRFSLVAAFQSGQWNLCYPDSWSGAVLADVGCHFGSASAEETGTSGERSFEQFGQLSDSDVILYQVNPDGSVEDPMREVLDQSGFQRLRAVSEDNAVPMRNFYVFCYSQALGALDELEAVLTR